MIAVEVEDPSWREALPEIETLTERAAQAALQEAQGEIVVLLADDEAVRALNAEFRGKDAPTNVLSFPMFQADLLDAIANTDDGEVLLGDIVLARETCAREAADKGVAVADHATHLIVHGTLHLLGHDHIDDAEAEAMEDIERAVLATLGIADPYLIRED